MNPLTELERALVEVAGCLATVAVRTDEFHDVTTAGVHHLVRAVGIVRQLQAGAVGVRAKAPSPHLDGLTIDVLVPLAVVCLEGGE